MQIEYHKWYSPILGHDMELKVYVVLQRFNLPRHPEANVKVVATKLTRKSAQAVVDITPGTWIEKHVATKD